MNGLTTLKSWIGALTEIGLMLLALVLEAKALAERDVPDYIEVDHNKMTAKLARVPTPGEIPYPVQMEPHLVVEFYSR